MPYTDSVTLEATFSLEPAHQFDQAGLMVRVDKDHWLETGAFVCLCVCVCVFLTLTLSLCLSVCLSHVQTSRFARLESMEMISKTY